MLPEGMKNWLELPKSVFDSSNEAEYGVILGQHSLMQADIYWPGSVVDQD